MSHIEMSLFYTVACVPYQDIGRCSKLFHWLR